MSTSVERVPSPSDGGADRVSQAPVVAPSPHLAVAGRSTRGMMVDVLIGLAPVVGAAVWFFRWHAVAQIGLCTLTCLAAEALFQRMRGRPATLGDGSAAVTGVILGLSLPAFMPLAENADAQRGAPFYVGIIAAIVAIGVGKVVFGGLGQNLFNPAMVGRAFVMIAFPASLGAGAYDLSGTRHGGVEEIVTKATPLTQLAAGGEHDLLPLFFGNVNGSLGETSALACLLGGIWLCVRRSASWEIPTGIVLAVVVLAGLGDLVAGEGPMSLPHHLLGGSLLFGAFFIATDPVSSPIAPRGKFLFGLGVGVFVLLIRKLSNYPEGVMFAVLLMNSITPLINRWTIPVPFGAEKKGEASA